MKYLKSYKIFEVKNYINPDNHGFTLELLTDISDIVLSLEDKGFEVGFDKLPIHDDKPAKFVIVITRKSGYFIVSDIIDDVEYILNHIKSDSRFKDIEYHARLFRVKDRVHRPNYTPKMNLSTDLSTKKEIMEFYISFNL